jgi:hypothetical protein
MPRRRLVFEVPKGKEQHYSEIPKGHLLGSVNAPLFHSYSYYMPAAAFAPSLHKEVDEKLKLQTWINYKQNALLMLPILLFGWTSVWRSIVGGVAWAEAESMFASWDGHVTFGSSHVSGHLVGFTLYKFIRLIFSSKGSIAFKTLIGVLGLLVGTWKTAYRFYHIWAAHSNFGAVGDVGLIHRVDNVAHIGGILTGMINAHYTHSAPTFKGL